MIPPPPRGPQPHRIREGDTRPPPTPMPSAGRVFNAEGEGLSIESMAVEFYCACAGFLLGMCAQAIWRIFP